MGARSIRIGARRPFRRKKLAGSTAIPGCARSSCTPWVAQTGIPVPEKAQCAKNVGAPTFQVKSEGLPSLRQPQTPILRLRPSGLRVSHSSAQSCLAGPGHGMNPGKALRPYSRDTAGKSLTPEGVRQRGYASPPSSEKSAMVVNSRKSSDSRARRFLRTASSSAITMTSSKKLSTTLRSPAISSSAS
jgi:hypothetical protein